MMEVACRKLSKLAKLLHLLTRKQKRWHRSFPMVTILKVCMLRSRDRVLRTQNSRISLTCWPTMTSVTQQLWTCRCRSRHCILTTSAVTLSIGNPTCCPQTSPSSFGHQPTGSSKYNPPQLLMIWFVKIKLKQLIIKIKLNKWWIMARRKRGKRTRCTFASTTWVT